MQCRPTNFDIAHQALGKPPEGKRMAEVDDLVGTRVEIARWRGVAKNFEDRGLYVWNRWSLANTTVDEGRPI